MNSSELSKIPETGGTENCGSDNSRALLRFISDQFNNAQCSQKCVKNVKCCQSGIIQTENIVKDLDLCDESIADYIRSMFIFHTVKEVSLKCETLSETIVNKLREQIMIHEIDKYMHLPLLARHTDVELTVLGITDLPKYEFRYTERVGIRCCVETLLREKIQKFVKRFGNSERSKRDVLKHNEIVTRQKLFECHDQQLIKQKEQIDNLLQKFENDIFKCRHLLNLWRGLKYDNANEIYCRKASYLLLQSRVAEVQAKIAKLSCLIRMFKETPSTLNAFKQLNKLVDEKLFAASYEIKQKEMVKKSYESLRGTEYDKVLINYLDLCKAVKRKQRILDRL